MFQLVAVAISSVARECLGKWLVRSLGREYGGSR